MATQSAVRYAEAAPEAVKKAMPAFEGAGRMDAMACVQALELELARAPLAADSRHQATARLFSRIRFFVVCASLAVVIGGVAGTLSSL